MRELHQEQIDAVLSLPGPQRYEHFVKQVADREEAWGLYADGWVLAGADDDGQEGFPLWPALEYAQLCAQDAWANCVPKPIPLADLMVELLPKLHSRGLAAAVFYTPANKGVVVDPRQLMNDLSAEASKYEQRRHVTIINSGSISGRLAATI